MDVIKYLPDSFIIYISTYLGSVKLISYVNN